MRKYRILFFLMSMTFLLSCEELIIKKTPENTPQGNFESLWNTVNDKYSFFEYKNIDWDSVYLAYRPRITPNMSNTELFDVLSAMLMELRDGHVNLISSFRTSQYRDWYLNSPQNFDYVLIERNYLKYDFRKTGVMLNKEIDGIGYIYIPTFGQPVTDTQIDFIIAQFYHLPGIIIDIRDNGGGNTEYVKKIISRFADKSRVVEHVVYKTGTSANDFSDIRKVVISPDGKRQFTKPTVLLTNRSSYSASNTFALHMKQFPHVTQIGDSTGGGGGTPIFCELPNGWRYRFSATISLSPDGFNIEHGVPADIFIDMKQEDKEDSKDTILEFAIDYLHSKSNAN